MEDIADLLWNAEASVLRALQCVHSLSRARAEPRVEDRRRVERLVAILATLATDVTTTVVPHGGSEVVVHATPDEKPTRRPTEGGHQLVVHATPDATRSEGGRTLEGAASERKRKREAHADHQTGTRRDEEKDASGGE